jgi:hypothetical protein
LWLPNLHLLRATTRVASTISSLPENEIQWHEKLKALATENQFPIPEYIKQVMVKYLNRTKDD